MQALGFDGEKAIEAYLICNRNEEQAINCLIADPNGLNNSGFVSLSPPCLIWPLILIHFKVVRREAPDQVQNHATSRTVRKFALTVEEIKALARVSATHTEFLA